MKTTRLEELGFESFGRLVKTRFRVWVGAGEVVELELEEVTPPRLAPARGGKNADYESFSLLFLGPADRVLPQRMYPFECEPLGRFELFIVPIGRDQHGVRYEAAFNRLKKSSDT